MLSWSEPRHILNESENRNIHLVIHIHINTLASISKSHFLFIRQIPDAESYLMAMLANFFMVRRSVEVELDKLTNAES